MLSRLRKKLSVKFQRSLQKAQNKRFEGPDAVLFRTAFTIFRIALKDPSAVLHSSNIDEKRLIKLESRGIYVVLNRYTIEVTNHNFSYHLELGPDSMNKMTRMFDNKLRRLLEEEEAQFKDQRAVGLLNVLDVLSYE